jgi:ligand-binding sensor domain-containing protein
MVQLAVFEARDGSLWFGSSDGWVTCCAGDALRVFTAKNGLVEALVHCIAEDRQGHLWFGTAAGVNRFDGETFQHFTTSDGLAGDRVFAIHADKSGTLWFATDEGVCVWEEGRFRAVEDADAPGECQVGSILEDRQGQLWFDTSAGVYRFDGTAWRHFTAEDGLSPGWPYGHRRDPRHHRRRRHQRRLWRQHRVPWLRATECPRRRRSALAGTQIGASPLRPGRQYTPGR